MYRGALMLNVTARQELMRTIVDTLGVVVEEARLDFGEDGLSVRVVDPSHVAMIKMEVDSAAFEGWEVDETKLGLEMRKLKEIVAIAGAGDMVELAYNDQSGQATIKIREQLEDAGLTVQEQIDLHGLEDNHCLYYVTK